ncbi:hypothetical protein MMC25_003769 [Agyrium rufum]|nr:hypothetical protein [Agyrium rufum]
MSISVALNTPLAEELSNVVQPKLVEVGWTTGGLDDSALAEYIILMLVNGKTQDQIAAELSNDLLNLGPEDSGANDFSRWLFEQVYIINARLSGESVAPPSGPSALRQIQSAAIPSEPQQMNATGSRRNSGAPSADSPDTAMGDSMEISQQDSSVPTGPKSMRTGSSGPGRVPAKRMMGQISKAMDRTNDAVLHRVRPQQGTERINKAPPKGPRNDMNRNQRTPVNGRPVRPLPTGMPPHGPGAASNLQMSPQQQMQLFQMYEQQAKMMSEIFGMPPQPMMIPGMNAPIINPNFQPGVAPQAGKSLFDRVEPNPQQRNNRNFNNNNNTNRNAPRENHFSKPAGDTDMADSDPTLSMDVETSQPKQDLDPNTVCRFNLKCTKSDCIFAHQSPASPAGTTIDVNDTCPFGAACKNRKCTARHPSPAQKTAHATEQDCKFFPNCTNPACPFRHPTMPMCRNGADCKREGCKFTHVRIPCKYNPCLNPVCPYKHEEGQKRGKFEDKTWTAEGGGAGGSQSGGGGRGDREHLSERRFVVGDDGGDEELIVPGQQSSDAGMGGSSQPNLATEMVT